MNGQTGKAVVVVQFDYTSDADNNPIFEVVDGLREFFADHDTKPVGNIWAAIGEDAAAVIAIQGVA